MAYGYMSSPSASPNQSTFTSPQFFDSTSDSSGPGSPPDSQPLMYNSFPGQFEMFPFGSNPSAYYTPQGEKIPVEYTGSSTLDERDRRRRRTGSVSSSKDKEILPNMHLRRRAQNRASQRAFRERKEKHVKGLEHQLDDLHEKHQELVQSYSRQAGEVSKLNARIQELSAEIEALRSTQDHSFNELLTPTRFDAVPGSDMFYSGPECYFDKNAVDMNSDFALSALDELL